MASLFEPVGPLDRRVYWRRRLILIAVVLVVLFLVLRACTGGDSPATDPTGSTSSPTPSVSSSGTATPSGSSSPKASSSATASATKSAAAVANCKDSDVVVTARPAKTNYAVGDTVSITYVVGTKGNVRCKRDVGGAANEVKVMANGQNIWSSDYCSPGGKKDIRTIGPDDSFSVIVAWDGDVTAPSCPEDRLPAPPGDYQVLGRNGAVTGASATLTLG